MNGNFTVREYRPQSRLNKVSFKISRKKSEHKLTTYKKRKKPVFLDERSNRAHNDSLEAAETVN